nr:PREDICTED: uncharacterized protein LOC109040367 isoform X1 [Bemisia tabaci]
MNPARILFVTLSCFLYICLVTAQGFFDTFGGPSFRGEELSRTQSRDPRENRGPVLFPPSAMAIGPETSGVVVGASGFGFVPPGQQKGFGHARGGPNFFDMFGFRRR